MNQNGCSVCSRFGPNVFILIFYTPEGTYYGMAHVVRPSVRPLAISCATNSSFNFQHNSFKLSGMIDTDV